MCASFFLSFLVRRLTLSTYIYIYIYFFYYFPQWKKKKKRSTFYHYYICSFYYLPLISSFLFVPIYIQIFIFLCFVFLDLNIYHPFQLLLVVHIQNDLYLFDNNNVLHVPLYVKSLDNQH